MDRKTLTTAGALAAVFLAGVAGHALVTGPANAQGGDQSVSISASADGARAWVVREGMAVQYCYVEGQYVYCIAD